MNVDNDIFGEKLSHHGPCLPDERRVARKYSLSDITRKSDAGNVDNGFVGEKPSHHSPYFSDKRGVARK